MAPAREVPRGLFLSYRTYGEKETIMLSTEESAVDFFILLLFWDQPYCDLPHTLGFVCL